MGLERDTDAVAGRDLRGAIVYAVTQLRRGGLEPVLCAPVNVHATVQYARAVKKP
jgi:hypothetical protein